MGAIAIEPARAEISVSSIQRIVTSEASARDGVQVDSPPAQSAGFVTKDFGQFETNLVNSASVVDAAAQSSAYQRSEIQPLLARVQANTSAKRKEAPPLGGTPLALP